MFANVMLGQQEAHYTHFMYNNLTLNPGVAGSKGHPTVLALYRKQWIGFEGAPESKLMSFHTPLGKRVGFGLSLTNDEIGISDSWYGAMAYAYRVQLSDDATVQIGIQGSMRFLGLDFDKPGTFILQNNDPSIANGVSRQYFGNFGAGLHLDLGNMFFGASVPYFFPNIIGFDNPSVTSDQIAIESPHFYISGGALIPLTSSSQTSIALRPSALAKIVKNAPFDLDLNLSVVFNNTIITGVSYRLGGDGQGESIDFLLHYRLSNIGLGVSYDYTLSELTNYNKGSIEAIVVYDFVKERVDMANPRYFF